MRGQIRIRSEAYDVRRVVQRWQSRYRASGAVHFADPSTLLVGADTEIEALENLLRSLRATEVEVMWRAPRAVRAVRKASRKSVDVPNAIAPSAVAPSAVAPSAVAVAPTEA